MQGYSPSPAKESPVMTSPDFSPQCWQGCAADRVFSGEARTRAVRAGGFVAFGAGARVLFLSFYISCILYILSGGVAWAAPMFRPAKEYRSIHTGDFEISIQKNGRTDVRSMRGEALFDNAFPQVLFADEEASEPLTVDARYTARAEVNDRLGRGQGMVFGKKECEWYIRSYPTKPFFTVQVVYINRGRKPVRVAKLIPWSVGEPKSGGVGLGPGAAQTLILENGRLFRSFSDYAEVVRDKSLSQWNLAAYNPASGRTMIAGFLTNERAYTQVYLERGAAGVANTFDQFRAECVYDPPVVVVPGGRLESEILYISVTEREPLRGLVRFGKAMAVMNGVRNERPFLPHGWDSWSTHYYKAIDEAKMLQNLDFVDRHLKRYGWNHFAIDAGWERGAGDWEPDPAKFPRGMQFLADAIHQRGMTAAIWTDLFTVPKDSALAGAHPEWMAGPHAMGKMMMGDANWILDVSAPGAYEYVVGVCAKLGQDWGFDALMEVDFAYHLLLAESYANPGLTRIEVFRRGMQAVREGFGKDKFIMGVTPQMVSGTVADGIRVGRDCAPVWRCENRMESSWGCVDTLTNAIRRFYMTPHLYVADQDCAFFGHKSSRERWEVTDRPELTWDQSLAWMTGAALTGGVVKIGEPFCELSDREVAVLRKLLPSPEWPATPVDLFQEGSPRIWSLGLDKPAGYWHILGLFNWDEGALQTISVPFSRLGLDAQDYYTVYDFWNERYLGLGRGALRVEVPAGGVRLFGLRRYENRPMFLATDRHYTQGALDHSVLVWDAGSRVLRGAFAGVADTDYTLRILAPEPYDFASGEVSVGSVAVVVEERVVRLSFHCAAGGPAKWSLQF